MDKDRNSNAPSLRIVRRFSVHAKVQIGLAAGDLVGRGLSDY